MPRYRPITWRGESRPLSHWARAAGVPASTLADRMGRGYALEAALTAPASHRAAGRRGRRASAWR